MADAKLLVASRNAKKLNELRRVLDTAGISGIELVGLNEVPEFPEAPETGATFEENALAKARDGAAATGFPCIADDSGLEVDALNAMPGVLSARWSGTHGNDDANTALLLAQLADVPDERRGAGFVSACALAIPGGAESVVRGEWRGSIARTPSGENGFGYDPIFVPDGDQLSADGDQLSADGDQLSADGDGRSAAELSAQEKDAASHRGRALRLLIPVLQSLGT